MVRPVTEDDTGIKILYEPLPGARDAGSASSVDIVAIHGIGTHPDDTWCKKVDVGGPEEHYVNWLKDIHMLPTVVPNARIMRYGYESQWFGEEAISQKASTVAQRLLLNLKRVRKACPLRPLIFIAHCFGGLVVLRAIVDANRSDSKWPGIFKSTTGMAFFGTPFRGAGGLNQSEMLQAAQSQYEEGQVQGAVLNILAPGNESLMDLMTFFFETRQEKNKAHVACFFEQKSSNVGAILRGSRIQKFVVDESSGCLDQSESTEKYSLSRDHFNMNKFGKPEEEDFQTVCEVIEKMVEESPQLIKGRDQGR